MDCGACMFLHALIFVFLSFNCCRGAAADCGACMLTYRRDSSSSRASASCAVSQDGVGSIPGLVIPKIL